MQPLHSSLISVGVSPLEKQMSNLGINERFLAPSVRHDTQPAGADPAQCINHAEAQAQHAPSKAWVVLDIAQEDLNEWMNVVIIIIALFPQGSYQSPW
jgi:hypothetical protein